MWSPSKYEEALKGLDWGALGEWGKWAEYALSGGGKRLRPSLAWESYAFYAGEKARWEEALPLLHAIEILHTFTLVHDDVMDRSVLRRGRPTLHRETDEATAILIGDALLIRVYEQLMELPPALCKVVGEILSRAALRVCYGQLLDLDLAKRPTETVSMETYLQMITEKTGALIGAALAAGAALAGASADEVALLHQAGEGIGRFFQLQDDYLDAFGEEIGKLRGGDIVERKRTFLWLWAWAEATPEEKASLEADDIPAENRRQIGLALYERLGLKERAAEYLRHQQREVEALFDSLQSAALLLKIMHRLMHRSK